MRVIDKDKFENRGGYGCSNSDYGLLRATCCGRFGVEDCELHDFYFDPTDLTKRIRLWENDACPYCSAAEWDLKAIDASDNVPDEWKWACSEG